MLPVKGPVVSFYQFLFLGHPPDPGEVPTVLAQPEEEAIMQLLCIPGQDFTRAAAKRRVRIMHTNMTTLTQIWMTLLLSNIRPSDHNADLPLWKYQLVCAIVT